MVKNKHQNVSILCFFFFNDTATTEIYTLSLHDRSSDLRNQPMEIFGCVQYNLQIHRRIYFRMNEECLQT